MIQFPCQCGHRFSFPDDRAGASVQCPNCKRLNDIPTLSDLAAIAPDGTYTFDRPAEDSRNHLGELVQAFGRDKLDADGKPKDLRITMEEVQAAGVDEIPLAKAGNPLRIGPKYDPITGELVRPIQIAPPMAKLAASGAATGIKRAISYATYDVTRRISPTGVLLELFMPGNVMVMSFIFLFHLMAQGTILLFLILKFLGMGLIVLVVVIIAHYGCVVEDIGPDEHDDLPRPLRSVSFGDDIWRPFFNFTVAFALCYGPGFFAISQLEATRGGYFIAGTLLALGTILLPAVAVTTLTSGSIENLRPDRVLGLIAGSGRQYVVLVLLWILTAAIYGGSIVACDTLATIQTYVSGGKVRSIFWILAVVGLMTGIYLMHFFCWQLGLFYRAGQASFPWVMQRHVKQNKREKVAMADAKRAAVPTAKRYQRK